jgi:hypothetical protein
MLHFVARFGNKPAPGAANFPDLPREAAGMAHAAEDG